MSHKDSNPIPASLRIGMMGVPATPSVPAQSKDLQYRRMNEDFEDYISNQVDWINDPNRIRDLVLRMKYIIDDLKDERDLQHDLPTEVRDWDIR